MKAMGTILSVLILVFPLAAGELAIEDLSVLQGDWTYSTMISGRVHTAPLKLEWDGRNLTGKTTYTNYENKTFHDIFRNWTLDESGAVTVSADRAGQPVTLKGTLSSDKRFIRGTCKVPFGSGEFVLNRKTEGALPDISGTYRFSHHLIGKQPKTGELAFLCDAGGELKGYLKLSDNEYSFNVSGTFSESGELAFSGWTKGKEMTCLTIRKDDGTFAEGKWNCGDRGGLFRLSK